MARRESHGGRLLPIVACWLSNMSEFLRLSEPFVVGCLSAEQPALWMAEPDGFQGTVKIREAPAAHRPCVSRACGCADSTGCWMFICLCSYWAICLDLIMTQLSSGPGPGGVRAWWGQRGGVCIALSSYRREGPATLSVPWGVYTLPALCPPPPGRHTLPLPCLAETCPIGPIGSPHPSTLREEAGLGCGESGVRRAGEGRQGQRDDTCMLGIHLDPILTSRGNGTLN